VGAVEVKRGAAAEASKRGSRGGETQRRMLSCVNLE
jgi:hypothetical protein